MSTWRVLVLVAAVTLLEVSVFPFVLKTMPPAAMSAVVTAMALAGGRRSVAACIAVGAWQDLLTGRMLGLHMLVYGGAALAVAYLAQQVDVERFVPYMIVGSVIVVAQRVVLFGSTRLFGIHVPGVIGAVVVSALLGLPLLVLWRLWLRPQSERVV